MAEPPEASSNSPLPDPIRDSRLDLVLSVLLAVSTIAIWGPVVQVGLNLGDEGWLLSAVDRLVGGERLYADIYRSYAPGLYWFFAALFGWFDADLLTIRWVWLFALALVSVGVYRLARTTSPAWAAFAAALVPVLLRAPVHKTFVPLCYFASLWLCRLTVDRFGSVPAMFAIGFGFGLVGLIRQEAAAFGLVIGLASLILMRSRSDPGPSPFATTLRAGTALAAGVAIVWIPVVAALAGQGSLAPAVEQLIVTGARGNAAMDLPFPDVQRILVGPNRLMASLFFLPGIATLLGAIATWRAWRQCPHSSHAILLGQWTAMALLSHTIFASRSDFPHLLQSLVAPCLILAYLAGIAWHTRVFGWHSPLRLGTIVLGLWILNAVFTFNDLPRQYTLRHEGVLLEVPRNEVRVYPTEAATLKRLIGAIQDSTSSAEPIFVLPYASGIYHLAARPNPTRHDAVLPGYASDEIQSEIVAALERSETSWIVIERVVYDGRSDRALAVYAPELASYIKQHFATTEWIGRFALMRRR